MTDFVTRGCGMQTTLRVRSSRLTVAELRHRDVASWQHLKKMRHPDAAAAEEAANWLSWLELGGAAEGTVYTYGWTVDKLLGAFKTVKFAEFTDTELLYILGTTTKKSRSRWAAVYKSWFNWGIRTRRIQTNPCDYLPDFRQSRQNVVEVFTVQEEAALRALPEPVGTLMALLFDTGMRKSEARMLRRKRIDFANERLIVIDGAKGGKQRVVPIDQDSAPFLLGRLDGLLTTEGISPDEYLWATRPGGGRIRHDRPITGPSMHQWWVDHVAHAGVPYRKLHTTRHTYATRWRQRGLDLGDIQLLLGHESIATTQAIYVHQDTEDVRRRMASARQLVEGRG